MNWHGNYVGPDIAPVSWPWWLVQRQAQNESQAKWTPLQAFAAGSWERWYLSPAAPKLRPWLWECRWPSRPQWQESLNQETAREIGPWWYSETLVPTMPEASCILLPSYVAQKLPSVFIKQLELVFCHLQPEEFWLYRKNKKKNLCVRWANFFFFWANFIPLKFH